MISLVSLEEAKEHLHITGSHWDGDIDTKILQASAIIFNYLKLDETSPLSFPWGTGEDVPFDVRAACFLVIGRLNQDREGNEEILTPAVKSLLHRWRDPAMA